MRKCCTNLPNLGKSAADLAKTMANALTHAVKTGEMTANPLVIEKRISVCSKCEKFTGQRCLECGCFVHLKAALQVSECPLKKW